MMASGTSEYRFDSFRLDTVSRVLHGPMDTVVDITPKALEILCVLIESHGQVVSKEDLMKLVWPDSFVEEANLSHHIFKLRKALGESDSHKLIETVPKRGYRFVGKLDPPAEPVDIPNDRVDASKRRSLILPAVLFAVLVLSVGIVWFATRSKKAEPGPLADVHEIQSIAVMPFVNEGGNADVEYLSDGMTETLIAGLSQLRDLGVKPSSVMKPYVGRDVSASTIGTDLNVRAVLYGRMVQHGSDLTLFLSLIDTQTEYQIWGKQYVKKLADLPSLQGEIGRDVAQSLSARLTGPDVGTLAKGYSQNPEAYRLYLLGRFYWNKFTGDGLKKAVDSFNQAIALDRNYALAYSGLADSYNVMGVNAHMPVTEAGPKTKEAAETAVRLDPQLGRAHLSLGAYRLFYEWDLDNAQNEFKMASELDPTLAGAHELSSYVLRAQRRSDEAIKEAKTALELEPLSPLMMEDLGTAHRFGGDPRTAIEMHKKVIEMEPTFSDARFEMGLALAQAGEFDHAVDEINSGLKLSGNSTHIKAGLGIVYARAGRKADAHKVISGLLADAKTNYVSPLDIALIYSAMNERDDAFAWIEKAYAERSCWLFELNADPDWDPIRQDPRFFDIVGRVGLKEGNDR